MPQQANAIDISEFQSLQASDFQSIKDAGIQTVFIRSTSGLRLDRKVRENLTNVKNAGLHWHLYHDWEGQDGEAEFAIKTAQELGLSSNQVLFYDMEGSHAGNWSDIFEDFRQKASEHFKVGLYISESPYRSRFNDSELQAKKVIRWIANYSREPQNYDIWQISGAGSGGFGSYTKDIDRDYVKIDDLNTKPFTPPTDLPTMVKNIVLQPMVVDGINGLGCSPDNGITNRIYWTIYGRKYYQEDGNRIWPFLVDKVKSVMSVSWNQIQGKPTLVTKAELDQRLAKLNISTTVSWNEITNKPDVALKSDLPSTSNLASKAELDKVKATADSALSNANQAQTTADANSNKFDNYVTTETLDSFEGAVSDLISNKADRAELPSIDTSSVNVNKQPSDYEDGFSYELKSLTTLGIDRSASHSSAQAGDLGLVTTKIVSYNGTKFARQVVEQLDNPRPLNYARNGYNSNWSSWEAATNW
ncbi:MAG: GH25 family lysozyme [Candidatus Limosilactobacillus intestinavium]